MTVAEEALTIARDRRSAGYGSPVEVDRAEDVYRQAHEDLIAAQADAAHGVVQPAARHRRHPDVVQCGAAIPPASEKSETPRGGAHR